LCASAVVMLDTACSEVVWRVLATHSIHQFPPHPRVRHRVPSHFNWSLTVVDMGMEFEYGYRAFFCKIKLLTNRRWRCLQRACYS
jgi:hypothetical protein